MNVGILTAGGPCPGVKEFVHYVEKYEKSIGNRVVGFKDGFYGLNRNLRVNLSVHPMHQSYEKVDVDKAVKTLKLVDRLYCLCGDEFMSDACTLALDDRIDTNIVGVAASIYNDVSGMECLGFRSAVVELATLVDTVFSVDAITFLVVPDALVTHVGYARPNKIISLVTPTRCDVLRAAHGVVVVSDTCDYWSVAEALGGGKVIYTGDRLGDVDACLYDSILANSMARDSFMYAQDHSNFIAGGGSNLVWFEKYLRTPSLDLSSSRVDSV